LLRKVKVRQLRKGSWGILLRKLSGCPTGVQQSPEAGKMFAEESKG